MRWPDLEQDGARARPIVSGRYVCAVWAAFTLIALGVERGALSGPFLSDDVGYIVTNRWVHELSLENLRALLDPFGAPAFWTANWAPVHLIAHALEWRVFGTSTPGYHVVNVIVHALASALLVPILAEAGVPLLVALFGALFFLLHPANVEVTSWIFQLKTMLSTVFALLALLAHPRRPALAATLFGLALLSKVTAVFAWPVMAWGEIEAWRRGRAGVRLGWVAVWGALFAGYAIPELVAFWGLGDPGLPLHPDRAVVARTLVAIGGRYLAMASTSWGVAAFQDPPRALSAFDPWFLAGVLLGALILARVVWALRRGSGEAAFWIWAAAAYAPVSQVIPFLYPIADRYLYDVLPGLLGAALLAGREVVARLAPRLAPATRLSLRRAGWACACIGLLLFANRSAARASLWRSELSVLADSARAYPSGISAALLRARRAAQARDVETVVAELHEAGTRGYDQYMYLRNDPAYAPIQHDPRFRAAVAELAGLWLEAVTPRGYSRPLELRALADAHATRGEWREAAAILERALERAGPEERPLLEQDLARAQRNLAAFDDAEQGNGTAP